MYHLIPIIACFVLSLSLYMHFLHYRRKNGYWGFSLRNRIPPGDRWYIRNGRCTHVAEVVTLEYYPDHGMRKVRCQICKEVFLETEDAHSIRLDG